MNPKKINPLELKNELLRVYECFIKDPLNKDNLGEIQKLDNDYMSATDILEEPLSSSIGVLQDLRDYGKDCGLNDNEIISLSKKILEDLRKS